MMIAAEAFLSNPIPPPIPGPAIGVWLIAAFLAAAFMVALEILSSRSRGEKGGEGRGDGGENEKVATVEEIVVDNEYDDSVPGDAA